VTNPGQQNTTPASNQSPTIPLPQATVKALQKKFHPNAAQLAKEIASNFATALVLHAKISAFERDDDDVSRNHVKEALETIRNQPKRRRWKEFTIFVSSTLLGVSGQGFVAELLKYNISPPTGDFATILTYGIITLVSLTIATIAITR